MTKEDFEKALVFVAEDLIAREQELSGLDSVVGDGDHGVTIRKGFTAIKKIFEKGKPVDMKTLLMDCGVTLAETSGGAIGPILSSLFLGMMKAAPKEEFFSTRELFMLFSKGLEEIKVTGGAVVGDKTLVDALEPAVEALYKNVGFEPKIAMKAAADAAFAGAMSTKNLISKKGRSRNLGERSIGHIDAGSMSMFYFLKAFAEALG